MCIGAGGHVYFFRLGIFYHLQKFGVQVGFALKIKREIKYMGLHLIDGFLKQIHCEHSSGSREGAQATWAFGASQITGSSRLDGNAKRKGDPNRFFEIFGKVEREPKFCRVPNALSIQFGQ